MALRAQRLLHLVRELDVAAARREAHRLEVEHPTATQPALHDLEREREVLGPVGSENDTCEMAARGVAGDVDTVRIAVEGLGVAMHPSDCAPHCSAIGTRLPPTSCTHAKSGTTKCAPACTNNSAAKALFLATSTRHAPPWICLLYTSDAADE